MDVLADGIVPTYIADAADVRTTVASARDAPTNRATPALSWPYALAALTVTPATRPASTRATSSFFTFFVPFDCRARGFAPRDAACPGVLRYAPPALPLPLAITAGPTRVRVRRRPGVIPPT